MTIKNSDKYNIIHKISLENLQGIQVSNIPGIVFTLVFLIIELIFYYYLVKSRMIPTLLLFICAIALILLTCLIFFLTRQPEKRARFIAGSVTTILIAVCFIYGTVALTRGIDTLNNITTVRTEISHVGIYILEDDEAKTINDLRDDLFGILNDMDRENTDKAIENINDNLGKEIITVGYDDLTALIDAVYTGDCRSIIVNGIFIEMLSESDGYQNIESQLREILNYEIKNEIEIEQSNVSEQDNSADEIDEVFTVYISGIDSRYGLTEKSCSDVNIIACVNMKTHQVLLISTPRDYYIPLSISEGKKDKLTHAGVYGVNVSKDTLSMLYDIDIDYYVKLSFQALVDIVDALGGVTVWSDYTFTSIGGYDFVEGYNVVDGESALEFARERYAFIDGDRQRGKNQMSLITAIVNEVISPAVLANYTELLKVAEDNFSTDIPYDLIASLVRDELESGADWEILTYSVDGTDSRGNVYTLNAEAYVMIPIESTVDLAKEMLDAIENGEVLTEE